MPVDIRERNIVMDDQIDRRGLLKCMAWAGTGVVWTLVGGIPQSAAFETMADAAGKTPTATRKFSFIQVSDSHIGFSRPENPDVTGTLREAVRRIGGLDVDPAFMIHTGDISHLSRPAQFDTAEQVLRESRIGEIHYVPGEHDVIGDDGKLYLERYGKGTRGAGWKSFDHGGVHFVGLVNVLNLKAGGLGNLGDEQLEWLEDDLAGRSASQPIVVFAHIPLWSVYPQWGWGTDDSARALGYLKRFGSVTVLNGHIHQVLQKVEGNVAFHTARSTAFPQPAPGSAKSPGPMKVDAARLKSVLGVAHVNYVPGVGPLAIVDTPLAS
jgi:3',5'-cyclic AMP phosphodiesterase CpdA